jgi:hypothetical protein
MRCLVVHPDGDRSRLQVLTTCAAQGLSNLVTATRHIFDDDKDADAYALDLACQNRMHYAGLQERQEAGLRRA